MERNGGIEDTLRLPTLVDLCCVSLAKAIGEGTYDFSSISNLPGELSERLLGSLSAQSVLTNESLLCVASPHLRTLNVANMKQIASHPDEVGIREALKTCTSLEELNCHGCMIDDTVLDLIQHSPFSPSLKQLDLSSCGGVTTQGLRGILMSCPRLESLNLSGCSITDDAFNLLDPAEPSPVMLERSLKRKFDCLDDDSEEELEQPEDCLEHTNKRAKSILMHTTVSSSLASDPTYGKLLVHLRSLNISGCCSLTNKGLHFISKLFPYLTRLDCSHIDTNESLDLRPVLTNCHFIKAININGCKIDQSGSFLANQALALEEISFCGTGTLTQNFYELLSHCAGSLRVVRLRNKSFSLRSDDGRAQDPTDWLQRCKSLSTLDLYSVTVGESALSQLLSTRCCNTLEILDITHCHVPERDLQLLCQTPLPRLQSLSLNHVAIVQWMMDLSRNCPQLHHLCLNLDLKALLPEQDVPKLLSGLSRLRELELWCCKSLSRSTLHLILEMCPNLRSLLLSTANSEEVPDDIEMGSAEDDSDWSEDEDRQRDRPETKSPAGHNHDHDHHDHSHGCGAPSWLSDDEFSCLTRGYPHVQFKIWHHTISGNRHFRFHNGYTSHDLIDRLVNPLKVNELGVRLKVQTKEEGHDIVPMILVDNIPIWSNETSASLNHLRQTTDGGAGGALPLISEWCCECNIESYNGVLFYHDADHVFWEAHEPGVKQRFRFSKEQYITAVNNARLQYMQLAWQLQRLKWVQQQQQQQQQQTGLVVGM